MSVYEGSCVRVQVNTCYGTHWTLEDIRRWSSSFTLIETRYSVVHCYTHSTKMTSEELVKKQNIDSKQLLVLKYFLETPQLS